MSIASTLKGDGNISLEERLQPTLRAAEREMASAEKITSVAERKLKAARVMEAVFNFGVIAISAYELRVGPVSDGAALARVALSVLVILLVFYDHQVYKSGEPEMSKSRAHMLKELILDVKSFICDYNGRVVDGPETEARVVAYYERRFGYIMENGFKTVEDLLEEEDGWARWKTSVVAGKGTTEKSTIV